MAGKRRDPAKVRHWRMVLGDWRRSGLSVRAFCDGNGLSEPSFYAWRRRLNQQGGMPAVQNDAQAAIPAARFLPVQVVADGPFNADSPASCLEVHLPSGVRLHVPGGFDQQTLTEVLAALGYDLGAPQC